MKHVILSTNDDPRYLYCLPITVATWKKLGYSAIVMVPEGWRGKLVDLASKACSGGTMFKYFESVHGVKESTLTQISRLFGTHKENDDDIFITGDADMLMLKDIFRCDGKVNTYGRDLTDFKHFPICYVEATGKQWKSIMHIVDRCTLITNMVMVLEHWCQQAYSEDKAVYWGADQDLLQKKLEAYTDEPVNVIERGIQPGGHLPIGRVDRYGWPKHLHIQPKIDCHLPVDCWKEEYHGDIMALLREVFPDDNWWWVENYKQCFTELMDLQK